ncbi:endoplasmic reticulum chaperone BiP-like isoform X1 [Triticum dicoccoides]|uniref:endoplasmic reticulum chaperone BiP-like isoform X1 n=1 Tax=Triticum dicoccoides TaxID=85692 RepID=UPI00188FF39F|nr:endoplasmic reticulum chaperone BiP-like isoform X1 [Triticum dicoccoides]XP_037484415.1 endoplasmic reticulum chaperone BiP-like isoform X1 [Triticum dicoccoides]XP_044323101.1 endoplasmic reticulum chaperone BiP-like isoform X1 [Triticum aestivum]XP_044323102.1 endoplasmic reticulum chaperone BiP-like isoform X1 [Triticum aestivum]
MLSGERILPPATSLAAFGLPRYPHPCSPLIFLLPPPSPLPFEIEIKERQSKSHHAKHRERRHFHLPANSKSERAIPMRGEEAEMAKGEGPAIGIDLGMTYSCVGVWQHDRVEIIANDQGNRTTPSYVNFTDTERLIGDAAKNQVAMNPTNTVFDLDALAE